MTKHTPGPWTVKAGQSNRTVLMPDDTTLIRAERGGTVAYLHTTNFDIDGKIDAANARLIAAAPDLLAVVKGALGFLQDLPPHYRPDERWFAPLRTAIAKAEGEP